MPQGSRRGPAAVIAALLAAVLLALSAPGAGPASAAAAPTAVVAQQGPAEEEPPQHLAERDRPGAAAERRGSDRPGPEGATAVAVRGARPWDPAPSDRCAARRPATGAVPCGPDRAQLQVLRC